jgi:Spy/CpxP family protein refolding chaperone
MRVFAGVMFLAGLLAVTAVSTAQPPGGGKQPPGKGDKGGKGGFGKGGFGKGGGGFGGIAPPQPGTIMPTFLAERLKLSDDQKKELETLQKDVDQKLAKILTEEQNKQFAEMKSRTRGGFGGPGGDRRPGGRPGGDKGGNPPPPSE